MNYDKAPFPWFGGKSQAAGAVWDALGDVEHFVEPFCGSMAVLLNRPHLANRSYHSETVNDADGLLVNAWRSIRFHPEDTAAAASWPVFEADLHARHVALVRWRAERDLERLMGDPSWCDPMMAGWWLWGQSSWIGSGWCAGMGPWTVGPDGRFYKQALGTREPGVRANRPHSGDNGQGVNRPQLREPGVNANLPRLGDDGNSVNHPQLREPGVEFHDVTMPKLVEWFNYLSARLRHVRITNGNWARACTSGATLTLSVKQGKGVCGVFLDPPYADTAGRTTGLYATDSLSVAHQVREWCLANGDNQRYRIVLAGFDGEHGTTLVDAGWTETEWFTKGWLSGGMGNTSTIGTGTGVQQARERLWLSPHCFAPGREVQASLW